jgi:hypothetical protein
MCKTFDKLSIPFQQALRALTKLCNFILSGQLPSEICHLLYGASLCAFHKKDGGIRPIALGNCLRRLTSKLTCSQSCNIANSYFYHVIPNATFKKIALYIYRLLHAKDNIHNMSISRFTKCLEPSLSPS